MYPAGLLLYWTASNTCTNPEERGKKEGIEKEERDREREREKEKREEADELGLMELKTKPIPRWPSTLAPTPKKAGKDLV